MNTKKILKARIAEVQAERSKAQDQAAREYLENGYTRRFAKLWRRVADLASDIEVLQMLVGNQGEPPKVGFTADYPPDTDEEEDADGYDEGGTFGGIYCRKESRK